MPIKGLTDRNAPKFPRIGFIRKGGPKRERNGKEIMGLDLDHFRFDSDDAEACAAFKEAYGDEPRQINVFFPWPDVDQNWQAWREEYTASALQHRCDGETCVLWLDKKTGEYSTDPEPCPGGCKEIGYLNVIIPELGRMAYVTVLTHSINDIMEIQNNLEAYQLLGGQLRGVPFVLRRIERKISTPSGKNDGKRARRAKWLMHLETKPGWTRLKLAGMEMDAIPANVRAALPAPVEAQYILDQYQADQIAERMDGMTPEEAAGVLHTNVEKMRGPDWNAFDEVAEGQFRVETLNGTPEQQSEPEFKPEPGEDVWADWKHPAHAKAWAMTQGKFSHGNHMERAYEKVKTDCAPKTARDMWRCWYEYVMAHEPASASETDSDEPLFS